MQVASAAALASACRGAYMARTLSNAIAIFAGTTSKLYKFASASSWSDFSGAATIRSAPMISGNLSRYGPSVYATNIANALQSCDVSSGRHLANVAGSCRLRPAILQWSATS